jgi:hypothetical protein
MRENGKSPMKKIKAKKDILLRTSMILFVVAYPLTYLGAGSGSAPFMIAAAVVTGLGSLLAAVL